MLPPVLALPPLFAAPPVAFVPLPDDEPLLHAASAAARQQPPAKATKRGALHLSPFSACMFVS
jgi:hypothetical protein